MTEQINYPWLLLSTLERLRDAIVDCNPVFIHNGIAYLYSLLKPYSSSLFKRLYYDIERDLAFELSAIQHMSRVKRSQMERSIILEANMAKFQLMVGEIDRFGYLKSIRDSSQE